MIKETELFGFGDGVRILRGEETTSELPRQLTSLDAESPLIVTDSNVANADALGFVTDELDDAGVTYTIFSGVEPNPTLENVRVGFEKYKEQGADSVIGVGGGSCLDAAKAISVKATSDSPLESYHGVDQLETGTVPCIAVPTTVGTGSEVSQGMVITDGERGEKLDIIDDRLSPAISILDSRVLSSLPTSVVASSSIDSLTQAIGAYTTKASNPITKPLARGAFEKIARNIRPAVELHDTESLSELQLAATMQGLAFTNSGLGLTHGLSNTIGGRFDTVHGITNGVLLPHVLEFNRPVCIEAYAELARAAGLNDGECECTAEELSKRFVGEVRAILEDVDVPEGLGELGVERDALDAIAREATIHVDSRGNPRDYTQSDLNEILEEAY